MKTKRETTNCTNPFDATLVFSVGHLCLDVGIVSVDGLECADIHMHWPNNLVDAGAEDSLGLCPLPYPEASHQFF